MRETFVNVEKAIRKRRKWLAICEANRLARNEKLNNSDLCINCWKRPKANNTLRCEVCTGLIRRKNKSRG